MQHAARMEEDGRRRTRCSHGLRVTPVRSDRRTLRPSLLLALLVPVIIAVHGCDRSPEVPARVIPAEEPSPLFRNVSTPTAYLGDSACASCHAAETSAYRQHAMAKSFHPWTPATRIETPLATPLVHGPTGFSYSVIDSGGRLYQVEFVPGPGGRRLHEQRRRIDYVMGSGEVARTYFTQENGRLFQLPLTWYRTYGWDFSPGYQINNARFDRLLPDRCLACHASYPRTLPHLEGKFAEVRPGIGCERCHGPGALHVAERRVAGGHNGAYDNSIVNPARLPLERRLDVCEQCHVHTAVTVLREGKHDFSYMPSQPLRDQYAFFKVAGGIDMVSHADRLRQSACFIATRATARPLECATCHSAHLPSPTRQTRNQPCMSCHEPAALETRLARSSSLADHAPASDCVGCHMPKVAVHTTIHGAFTDHWIRSDTRTKPPVSAARDGDSPIEPFYERDRTGTDARIYQGMGEIVYATRATRGRMLSDAAGALDRALALDTARADANFLLGVASQQLGNTDDAIRTLERSIRVDSNRPDRLRALAQSYERAGRPAADIEHQYRRALALQPALAWIRADYADFLQARGRRDEAIREYRRALVEQPGLAAGWFNLGAVLAEAERSRESADAFEHAVQLDPTLAQALSPLLELNVATGRVVGVRSAPLPLATLTMRERDSRATRLTVPVDGAAPGVTFVNVPSRGIVQILKPDGTILRTLPTSTGGTLRWDLLLDTGAPIAGGLYRARVVGSGASGQSVAPQLFYFGVVRQRAG